MKISRILDSLNPWQTVHMIDVTGPLLVVGAQPCSRVIAHLNHASAQIIDLMGPKGRGITGKLIIDIRIGRKLGL